MVTFEGIIGHRQVLELLSAEASAPGQAYFFVGPSSSGKATVARHFAADLVGGDAEGRRRVLAGLHPDVVLVEPDGRTALTVDVARSVVAQASLSPVESVGKVFLFEEAGLMNDEAANALLKTLEEPAPSTVFVLVAESEDDLPDTVASRCRTVVFGRVSETEIAKALSDRGVDPEQAENAARISGGRPGLALALATRPEVAQFRRAWLSVPQEATAAPGQAYLLAGRVLAAAEPLLAAIKDRQGRQSESVGGGRVLAEVHERELKRASASLNATGLEMLAGFYRDAVAAQCGAPVRNHDIGVRALSAVPTAAAMQRAWRVLNTVELLEANQRPHLALAALFAELGAEA